NMKYLLLLLTPLLFIQCNKEDDAKTAFRIELHNLNFEIPAGLNIFESHHFIIRNVPTNFRALLDQSGLTEEEVTGIDPRAGNMLAIFPSDDYGFIYEVSVRLYVEDNPTDIMEVFYRENVPENTGADVGLIPSLADAQRMLTNDLVTVEVVLRRLRGSTSSSIESRLEHESRPDSGIRNFRDVIEDGNWHQVPFLLLAAALARCHCVVFEGRYELTRIRLDAKSAIVLCSKGIGSVRSTNDILVERSAKAP
ncbi:MAG: hypothetical protein GY706_07120, partial [Bacteroides sp.]|nr:hypothetical protein [Bacteroides sp.]